MTIRFRTLTALAVAAAVVSTTAIATAGTHETAITVQKPPIKDKDKSDPPRVSKPPKGHKHGDGGDPGP